MSSCLQWCRADFFWQAYEYPQAKRIRAIDVKGRERIWPGETLQHDCTGAIKNITRDEYTHVYLAEEKARCALLWYSYSFGHRRRRKSKQKNAERWKEARKANFGVCSCWWCCRWGNERHHICAKNTKSSELRNVVIMKQFGVQELKMLGIYWGWGKTGIPYWEEMQNVSCNSSYPLTGHSIRNTLLVPG